MKTIAEFRKEYPQYDDVSDQDLARTLHQKYYSDIDEAEFNQKFLATPSVGASGIGAAFGAGVDKLQEYGYRAVKGFTDVGVPREEQTNALGRAIGQGGSLSRWADEGIRRNIREAQAYKPSVASYKDIDSIGDAASYVGELTANSLPIMAASLNPAALFTLGGGMSNEAYEAQPEDDKQPLRAAISGFGQAGLERLGVETAIGRVLGGEGVNLAKRVRNSALVEGTTEVAQDSLAQWGAGKSIDEFENLDESFVGGMAVGGSIAVGTESGKSVYERYRGDNEKPKPELDEFDDVDLTQEPEAIADAVEPDSTTGDFVSTIPGQESQTWQPNWQFGNNDMPYRGQMQPYTYEGEYEQYRDAPRSVPVGAALDAPVIDGQFERPRGLPDRSDVIYGEDGRPLQQAQEFADSVGQAANSALPFDDVIYAPGAQAEQAQNENAAGDAYWQEQQARSGNEVNRRQLEREAQNYQGAPQIPQKDIIFADDGRGVQVKRNGKPFGGRRAAELTKEFRQAKSEGLNPKVVKINGGYGWVTSGGQQSALNNDSVEGVQPEQSALKTKPAVRKPKVNNERTTKVYTPTGREVDVEYAIVDADQLVTSNLDDGRVNPDYPQMLQPRDRTRASSEIQINSIANNINPALLGESATTGDGAPIVSDAGVVESGNGRSLAVKRAYQYGKADKYKNALIEQGYDVSGFEKPVLVRVRRSQMDDADLVAYTKESNERSTLSLSASEQAKSDAKAISRIIGDYQGGDLTAAGNRDFVRKFMQGTVSQSEQASMIDSTGALSQDGRRRVEAAMISAAYDDASLVNDLFESSDSEIKSIGGALLDVSGSWAKMRASTQAGATQSDVDITSNVVDAVNLVRRSRQEGKKLSEMVSQTDIFAGDVDPTTKLVLGIFYDSETYSKPRSRQRVRDALNRYAELANETQGGDDLFGGELESVKPDQLLGKANEANEQTDRQAEGQQDLLSQSAEPVGQGGRGSRGEGERSEISGNGQAGTEPQNQSAVIEAAANEAATSPTNNLPEPTQAQKEAGNYKKGKVKLHGFDISIENPKGSTRTGTDPDGKEWSSKMKHHYGDIKGTTGADGDSIDVFIGDNPDSQKVFVVDQVDPGNGAFDEVKVMMGFDNIDAARKGYLSNYDKNWKGLGEITETTVDEFKAWTQRPRKSKQPFALPVEPKPTTTKQHGVSVSVPTISKSVEEAYNRTTHIGKGRDFNAELNSAANDILTDLNEKDLLDTPERQAKAKEQIEKYLNEQAQFIRRESIRSQNNPSWVVTGRGNMDTDKYNKRADKNRAAWQKDVDKLDGMRKRIPGIVESVMNDQQRQAKAKREAVAEKLNNRNEVARLVGTIAGDVSEGKMELAKETRKWANKKIETLLDGMPKDEAKELIETVDKATQKQGGILNVVGHRSNLAKKITEIQGEPAKSPATTTPHEQRQQFWDRFNKADETLTVADAKAAMDAVLNNETQIKEFIGGHTVAQIKDKFYQGWHDSGMRKDDLVDSSYEQMVTEFGFIASGEGPLSITGIGRNARFNNIKQKLEGLTDAQLIENMKARKATVDNAISERKARVDGMQDPQTLEDFRNAARAGLSTDFTPEQWAQYDRLHADERLAEQEQRETKQISAVDGDVNYDTFETTHSKKGHDIFGVSLSDRVDRDLYNELNTKAKQLGGYYSSYNKQGAIPGFQFRTEEARAEFLKVLGGESVEKTKVAKDKTNHLTELADRIEERANDVLSADRKTNTAKRAREAGYAIGNAEAELQKAAELRAISDAIQSGTAKYIAKMSNGTERDLLASLWSGLRHNAPKDLVETRYEGGMAGGLKWKEGVSPEQKVRAAEYPLTRMYPDMVKRVAEKMAETKGYTMAGKKLLADAQTAMRKNTEGRQRMYLANHKHFGKFREFIKENSDNAYFEEVAKDFNRLRRMGITTTPMLRAALLEYNSIASGVAPAGSGNSAVKQQLALSKFQGKYKENDFFNSTPTVVKHVMEHANIEEGMSVFEPSAGVGSLADAAANIVGKSNVDTNELASGLREYLTQQGYRPTSADFLTMSPERTFTFGDIFEAPDGTRGIMRGSTRDRVRLVDENGDSVGPTRYYTRSELVGVEKRGIGSGYDRIIMNPPFSKGQEARHVAHAYRFLKPGGRLVAVTSSMAGERSNKTDAQFREWLDNIAADEYPLPEGAFKEAINSTNVNAKVIVIDKPAEKSADVEPPLFALNAGAVVGRASDMAVSRANANKVVSRFLDSWGDTNARGDVTVAQTYDDLPQEIKDAAKAQGAEYQVKGVFHKGKVHVVLDQHTSPLDVETTLFHEVYGHQGVAKLFGKDITKKLNELFLANGGLKGLRDTAKRHGINLGGYIDGLDGTALPQDIKNRILMDELLAHMQQDNKPSVKRLAREIIGMVRAGLRKLGLPGLARATDGDLFYILRKARSSVQSSKGSDSSPPIFRTSNDGASSNFSVADESLFEKYIVRYLQDKFSRVKATQKAIADAGIETSEKADVYGIESLYYGKVEEDFRLLAEKYLEPMAEKMARHNIKQEELDLFLYALHAPERNAHIHSMDEEMTAGSGMTDDEARAIIDSINRDPRRRQFNELANQVREMIDSRTAEMFNKGLIDEETFSGYQNNYQFYVPLKGQANDEGGKPKGTGMGFNIKGKESIAALGRQSRAESPLLHAYMDTQKAIIRGHKNEVGNALINLINEAPNPDLWSVYTTEGPLERKKGPDGKIQMVPMSKEKMSALASNPQSEWFATKRDGMEYYVKLDDPVLAMQMKNVGVDNGNRITRALGSVNRFLAMMATSANPEFLITNVARDVQTAMHNLAAESDVDDGRIRGVDIKDFTGKVLKDMPKSFAGIRRVLRENRTDTEWAGHFDTFRKAGAKTGYFDMKDIEAQSKDLQELMKLQSKPGLIKHGKAALKFIDDYNSAVENAIRLSVFKNAIDAGVSQHQAAVLAKNLTVNFNRKGQAGTWLNSLYLFANAGIQGTANFARAIGTFKTVDGKVKMNLAQKAGLAIAGISLAMSYLNRLIAGEDDDGESYWDKVPDYVKERNFVLMIPGSNEYVTFPMPYGYNIFANFGTAAESLLNGGDASDNAGFLVKAAMGSFVPIGMSEGSDALQTTIKSTAPQILKPFVDLDTNTNFFGSAIYNEANEKYGSKKSDAGSGFKGTNDFYKNAALGINELTGGSEYQSGAIDVHPESIRYMMEYLGGGLGRFVLNTAETADRATKGEFEPGRTPFVRRFYSETTDFGDSNTFYDRLDELETLSAEFDSLRGREKLDFRKENKDKLRLVAAAQSTAKQLRAMRKRLDRYKEREDKERIEQVEQQMEKAIDRFNLKYNRLDD